MELGPHCSAGCLEPETAEEGPGKADSTWLKGERSGKDRRGERARKGIGGPLPVLKIQVTREIQDACILAFIFYIKKKKRERDEDKFKAWKDS